MKDYSLKEQVEILQEGIKKFEQYIGKRPLAHRAGGYAANYDTLLALSRVGIAIDSSMFYQHENCALNEPVLTKNSAILYKGSILELPVTCFEKVKGYKIGPFRQKKSSISKIDIDWCNYNELKEAIQALRDAEVNPVVIFLHSYTFVRWDKDYKRFYPDYTDVNEFDSLLSWINSQGWRVVTIEKLAENAKEILKNSDIVPQIIIEEGYIGLLSHSVSLLKTFWKARAIISIHLLGFALFITLISFYSRYRMRLHTSKSRKK